MDEETKSEKLARMGKEFQEELRAIVSEPLARRGARSALLYVVGVLEQYRQLYPSMWADRQARDMTKLMLDAAEALHG